MTQRQTDYIFGPTLWVLMGCILVCSAGCENSVDNSENNLWVGDEQMDMGHTDGEVTAECRSCIEVGQWFRFNRLEVKSIAHEPAEQPATECQTPGSNTECEAGRVCTSDLTCSGLPNEFNPLIPILNSIWDGDIGRNELNIIFEVTSVDADGFTVRGLNAGRLAMGSEQTPESYCLLPNTEVILRFAPVGDGCRYRTVEPGGLNIFAGTREYPKNCAPGIDVPHTIAVRQVSLELTMAPNCESFDDGVAVSATIPFDSLSQTCNCVTIGQGAEGCGELDPDYVGMDCDGCNGNYTNLAGQMAMFNGGQPLPADCPTADGEPGICLGAAFGAELLSFTPSYCDPM